MAGPIADTRGALRIHLLDMNDKRYGDCIVCEYGQQTILIDGGRLGDQNPRGRFPSIPQQLRSIFNTPPPYRFSLLVVTHCHGDHIGCLRAMIRDGTITADWALLADSYMGFGYGPPGSHDAPRFGVSDLTPEEIGMLTALREESHADDTADEIAQFLEDSMTMEERYDDIIRRLQRQGTNIRLYGRDDVSDLVAHFAPMGLEILGPSRQHLELCATRLAQDGADMIARLRGLPAADRASFAAVDTYRALAAPQGVDAADRPGKGAILNDMSIVLKLAAAGNRVLLPGDMQFAAAEVDGLENDMTRLRGIVETAGPYDFVKVAHHSSYNGLDAGVYGEMGNCPIYGHTGGASTTPHPHSSVLDLLRRHNDEIWWLRTDRNGLISLELTPSEYGVRWARGRYNDFRRGSQDALPEMTAGITPSVSGVGDGQVEVAVRIPRARTRVTLTIDVDGEGAQTTTVVPAAPGGGAPEPPRSLRRPRRRQSDTPGELRFAGGRELPPLLFVSSRAALARKIGAEATDQAFRAIRAAGQAVFEGISENAAPPDAVAMVRAHLASLEAAGSPVRGVVLVGGYDVVPSQRTDTIGDELRRSLRGTDSDRYIVWSDDAYGDTDSDQLPELPVSRIPDGGSASVLFKALSAERPHGSRGRFGVRNSQREFANFVFDMLEGDQAVFVSGPQTSLDIEPRPHGADSEYFMLHGGANDATTFWGESVDGHGYPEAFTLDNIPQEFSGVVLTGCCWGALPVNTPAVRAVGARRPVGRTPDDSIALAYLRAGALAFVGCTGSHYSPIEEPFGYYGHPMHTEFWERVRSDMPPAQALFEAKMAYGAAIPHHRTGRRDVAIELKIFRQFTCLGLGW